MQITDRYYSYNLRAFRARWFDPLNADGDKVLSSAEASSLLDEPAFAAADTDHDGSLSLKEYAFYHAQHPLKSASFAEESMDWAKRYLEKYDLNKDGALTEDEWKLMIVKPQTSTDANGDGVITTEEFAASRAK